MKKLVRFFVGVFLGLCLLTVPALAAPLFNVPTTVTQPDGTVLELYSSGDEFFNYIHDADGLLVMKNDEGWYVYAQEENGSPAATGRVVGAAPRDGELSFFSTPRGMTVRDIDFEAHPELRHEYPVQEEVMLASVDGEVEVQAESQLTSKVAPKMANLVIFIRFKGEEEFVTGSMAAQDPKAAVPPDVQSQSGLTELDFGNSYTQVSTYMDKVSNGLFDIETTFLTADKTGKVICSYEDIYPRSYFEPYSASNPNGVSGGGDDRAYREMYLLERALMATGDSLGFVGWPELDYDGDGRIDNITFIVSGSTAGWSDLLWPHSWALQLDKISFHSGAENGPFKLAYQFNFNFANPRYAGTGVLSHELLHSVGYPDLYRYDYSGDPVGAWDAMGSTDYADPQFLGAYLKDAYAGWGRIGEITGSGTYTLYPIGTERDKNGAAPLEGYRIPTDVMGEYIYVEYRKSGTYGDMTQDNVPRNGLLVYRANRKTVAGNRNGTVNGGDEVYIFRPGDSAPNAGTSKELNKAALSDAYGYTSIGGEKDSALASEETIYYNSGENTGIVVDQVTVNSDGTISFRVTLPHAPTSIAPGRYDVGDQSMGDTWYIDQPGEYTFYGTATDRQIVVAVNTPDVRITMENLKMDLSATESRSPITLRGGSEVELAVEGQVSLKGGGYAAGILVEENAQATVTGPGFLTAAGGVGAPAIGGSAFTNGGWITLKDMRGLFTGGDPFQLNSGNTIMMVSYGSSALGVGCQQTCQGITIENCDLTVRGGGNVHSIATSYAYGTSDYTTGGDIVIRDSQISAFGGVLAGPSLTAERSALTVFADGDLYYGSTLTATKKLTLTDCQTRLEASGVYSAINSQNVNCEVEIRGGSLWGLAWSGGILGKRVAISASTQVMLASVSARDLLRGPDEELQDGGIILVPASDGTQAVLFQGVFTEALGYGGLMALVDNGSYRSYVELPKRAKTVLLSLPAYGSYTLIDHREAQCTGIKATGEFNRATGLSFQEQPVGKIPIDLTVGSYTVAQNGSYILTGFQGEASLTVAPNVTATIYLDGVDLTGPTGQSALSLGANASVRIIAYNRSENILRGMGAPALSAPSGSTVTLTGTGTLLTIGQGASAVSAGTLTVDQSIGFTALSDQTGAVTRRAGSWKPSDGAEPTIVYGQFSQPLGKGTVTFAGGLTATRVEAPAGTKSFLHNLGQQDTIRLRIADGSVSQEVSCRQAETDAGVLTLTREGWVTMTLDLSEDSYTVTQNGTYTIIGTTDRNCLQVASNVSATLVLQNVNVDQRADNGMVRVPNGIIELGSNADVTVEVPQGTRSSLKVNLSGQQYVSAIYVPATARLTLRGEGDLYLQGGPYGVALGAHERVSAGEIIVEGTKLSLDCYGGSGVVLGGPSAKVTITGGTVTTVYHYGATVGGSGSTVLVAGGVLSLRGRQMEAALGGAGSGVTITGGTVNLLMPINTSGIGGQGAQVQVRGGKIVSVGEGGSEPYACKYILGGKDSRITMTGGSLDGEVYRRYGDYTGGLGGEGATASFGGSAQVLLRLLEETAPPLSNADLLQDQEGCFLEVRFAHALKSNDTITLTPKSGGAPYQITLPQGAWGFFILLPQGVYDMTDSAGGYGGAAGLGQAGVTKLEDVTFNRLEGVYFENRTFPYDGMTHTITLSGFTSSMGTVTYSDNSKREPGTYTAKAVVTPTGGTPYTLTATLTITKGTLTVTGVKANHKAVYDGTTATTGQVLYTGAVGGDIPGFRARFAFADPNVGQNKMVNVTNIILDSQWAGRYDLRYTNGMGATATTTASILSPAPATITIDGGSLYQLAGNVKPLVYTVKPAGLACSVTYNGSTTLPQAVGEYPVTVTVDNSKNPNYAGTATAALVVAQGIDLSQGSLTISQPGSYLVTGTTTANTITVNKCSGTVKIYLSGVDVRLTAAGASPLNIADMNYNVEIYALPGTENLLRGGPGAPAVNNSGTTTVVFKGTGELSLLGGSGSSKAVQTGYPFTGDSLPIVGSTQSWGGGTLISYGLLGNRWVVYSFASAPTQDIPMVFRQEGYGSREVTLPAGYRTLIIPAFQVGSDARTQLLDREGRELSYTVWQSYGDLTLYNVPYAYVEPVAQVIDITNSSKWPHKITQNGVYRIVGDNSKNIPVDTDYTFQEWHPMLEVSDNVVAQLIFDNVTVERCTMGTLVKMGKGSRVTVDLVGKNTLTNYWDSIFAEPFSAGNSCTSQLILRNGGAGARAAVGSAQLSFGYYSGVDNEGKNGGDAYGVGAAIHVGELKIEGGDWTVIALKGTSPSWRSAVWGVRTYGDITMTGGSLTIQGEVEGNEVGGNPIQNNNVKAFGGLWAQGNVRLTGDSVLNIYNKAGSYANAPHYYAAVYCGTRNDSSSKYGLHLDGEGVKMTVNTAGTGGAIRADTVELLRGELDLAVRYVNNTGLKNVKTLTLGPDFVLNGCANYVDTDASPANILLVPGVNFELLGVNGSQPVLVNMDLLNRIRPTTRTSGFTLQVTSPDYPDYSRTVAFPSLYDSSIKLEEYWSYQSFLLSLPGPGEYEFFYVDQVNNRKTRTITLGEGFTAETDVTFATAASIAGLDLPDGTFTWDGKPKSLSLTGTLPTGAIVSYSGNDQTEPGTHYVTVTVQAPGYREWSKTAKLTIKKAPLSVESVRADDKEMYDGTTLTTGTVVLSGAISGDDITATAQFHFDTPNVGRNKTVTVTNFQIRGGEDHYEVALPDKPITTTASILNKAPVTITWTDPTLTQVYGSVTAVGAVAVDPLTVGKVGEDGTPMEAVKLKVNVTYSGGALPTLPGSYLVTATVEDNNYEGSAQNTLLVQPRPITITGLEVPSIHQGDELSLTVTLDRAHTQAFGVLSQDLEGVTVSYTAVYPDDTPGEKTVAIEEWTLTGDKAGRYRLEAAATGTGTVLGANAPRLSSITVKAPTKTSYKKGEILDKAGMKVTAVYSDGSTKDVTGNAVCMPIQLTEAGTVTVTVSYQGKTATFPVTVIETTLSSITVKVPTKTSYKKGETLDKAGMKVTAVYSDGSTKDVTADAVCEPMQLAEAGTVTVTVSYQGKTASFSVTVTETTVTTPSGNGGGGGGSFGGGGGSSTTPTTPTTPPVVESQPPQTTLPEEPPVEEPPKSDAPQVVNTDPLPFIDLDRHQWAVPDITWCYRRGLVQGVSAQLYGPELFMNRAMFITVLGRMESVDTAKYPDSSFDDVVAGSWYAPYVAWGYELGVIKGRSETAFDPFTPISRQEAALIIDRYLKIRSVEVTAGEDAAAFFADGDKINKWASESVESIRETGLMKGYPDGTFGPQRQLLRAEATVLLYRLCQLRYPTP